jgi:hypothetical protein
MELDVALCDEGGDAKRAKNGVNFARRKIPKFAQSLCGRLYYEFRSPPRIYTPFSSSILPIELVGRDPLMISSSRRSFPAAMLASARRAVTRAAPTTARVSVQSLSSGFASHGVAATALRAGALAHLPRRGLSSAAAAPEPADDFMVSLLVERCHWMRDALTGRLSKA